jgi:hypothetical protein
MMLNLFHEASRFHAHNADLMGSEISDLVEDDTRSRVRRALAGHRIVSNLLQWGWNSPTYISHEQMETFIRGQLFWGFYPAVSSAGGMLTGGTPDRYFHHPDLYERDRPLFQHYIPIIQAISAAGWEPITATMSSSSANIERFGDFTRSPVYLTVRGPDGAALAAEVTLNLEGCALPSPWRLLDGYDMHTGTAVTVQRSDDLATLRFDVSLAAGAVGVYRFTPRLAGDFDEDGDVDLDDFASLAFCLQGPNTTYAAGHFCRERDFDNDADVDLADYRLMAGMLADPP